MKRVFYICTAGIFLFSSFSSKKSIDSLKQSEIKPNVVIIFLDDSGYSDFSPFQGAHQPTPYVTQLAKEGTTFTNFHVPQAVCSASRAALLTGCYPGRTKVFGAHPPRAIGLDPQFATLAQQLKKGGYSTGWFGKWHVGDTAETRPDKRGFDVTAGLMYSDDMWNHHPVDPDFWGKYPLQYWENGKIIIQDVDSVQQKSLTKWSTNYTLNFIEEHKQEPFFLYLAYSMPHVPIFCSDEFEGKSGKGLYGDVIMELDHSIGLIDQKLKDLGLNNNSLVVFSSDNGPWTGFGNHAGKTPFRELKATSFDGGLRTQLIIKYPGVIPPNRESNKFLYSIDLMPTIYDLTNSPLPEYELDGENVLEMLKGDANAVYKRDYHAFSNGKQFEGVFSKHGNWKLHLAHDYRHVEKHGNDGTPGSYIYKKIGVSLFDMKNDPYETIDVKEKYPELVDKLTQYSELHKDTFFKE